MIIKQSTLDFSPVTVTLETFEEFKAFTKIVQDYAPEDPDNIDEPTYLFSVKLYNELDTIHPL